LILARDLILALRIIKALTALYREPL